MIGTSKRVTRALLACAVALVPLSCSEPGNDTEVIVEVRSDIAEELAVVTVSIRNPSGTRTGGAHDFEVGPGALTGFPLRFAVDPRNDDGASFLIEVEGRDRDDTTLVVAKARSRFVPGRSVQVSMRLVADCAAVFCEDDAEACLPDEAACGPVPTLGSTLDEEPTLETDAAPSAARDAGRDAGPAPVRDAAPARDAGTSVEDDAAMMQPREPAPAPADGGLTTPAQDPVMVDVDAGLIDVDAGRGTRDASSSGGTGSSAAASLPGSSSREGCTQSSPAGAYGCSELYCGTSQLAIADSLTAGATCTSASFACSGEPSLRAKNSLQRFQADTSMTLEQRYILATMDMMSSPAVSSSISAACARCYIDYSACADSQCLAKFFACSGLPDPY